MVEEDVGFQLFPGLFPLFYLLLVFAEGGDFDAVLVELEDRGAEGARVQREVLLELVRGGGFLFLFAGGEHRGDVVIVESVQVVEVVEVAEITLHLSQRPLPLHKRMPHNLRPIIPGPRHLLQHPIHQIPQLHIHILRIPHPIMQNLRYQLMV